MNLFAVKNKDLGYNWLVLAGSETEMLRIVHKKLNPQDTKYVLNGQITPDTIAKVLREAGWSMDVLGYIGDNIFTMRS